MGRMPVLFAALVMTAGCTTRAAGPVTPAAMVPSSSLAPAGASTTTVAPLEPSTTAPAAHPSPSRATRSRPLPAFAAVASTAYCLPGRMADGRPARMGAVAGNLWPLGTVLVVSDSPFGPGVFVVEDRIGWGSQLDFAMPGDCAGAVRWGRRPVTVSVGR